MNKKPSYIDSLTFEEFQYLINQSFSRKDFFRKINMLAAGASFKILNRRIERDKIDISHFKKPQSFQTPFNKKPYEEILVENSQYHNTHNLKNRLVKDGLLNYICNICGNIGIHCEKELILQLDHINGIRNDNRLENLQILCPNCHSQTKTFSGKNNHREKKKFTCSNCSKEKSAYGKLCVPCARIKSRKALRPSKQELEKLVAEIPMTHIGKIYGVSDSAVKKWCKKLGIELKPMRGYWAKKAKKMVSCEGFEPSTTSL